MKNEHIAIIALLSFWLTYAATLVSMLGPTSLFDYGIAVGFMAQAVFVTWAAIRLYNSK